MGNTLKLIVQIAGIAHEIGEYAAPVIDHLMRIRSKGPKRPDTGQEESFEETAARIKAALETATEGQAEARKELDALDAKEQSTKLDG